MLAVNRTDSKESSCRPSVVTVLLQACEDDRVFGLKSSLHESLKTNRNQENFRVQGLKGFVGCSRTGFHGAKGLGGVFKKAHGAS